jgi:hypothetical protein
MKTRIAILLAVLSLFVVGPGSLPAQPAVPTIFDIRREGTGWQISVQSATNCVYELQRAPGLAPADWAAVLSNVPGNGGVLVLADGSAGTGAFYRVGVRAARGKVVVNEVQTRGAGGTADEFVELYNTEAYNIDLNGWQLLYRNAADNSGGASLVYYTFTNLLIGANSYALLAGGGFTGTATVDGLLAGGLSSAGGAVGLADITGTLVDSVSWQTLTASNLFTESSAAANPPSGQSIGRSPNGSDTGDNASDFKISPATSPRAANP